jgi:predicted enzyme related to lactoylglutathione lyase
MLMGAVLYAKNMQLLANFYQWLGFELTDQSADFTILENAQTELSIIQAPQAIAVSIELGDPAESRAQTPIKLVFLVDSIEAISSRLSKHGGRMDRGHARWEFGPYFVQDAVDPEGNIFQLRERRE